MRASCITCVLIAASCSERPPSAASVSDGPAQLEWFTERAHETGLGFVHFNGMTGSFYFPEVIPPGVALFDYDDDGELDADEPSAVTDADGNYSITGIYAGTWKIREVLQDGWTCTFPLDDDGKGCYYEETFVSGSAFEGNDFGNFRRLSQLTDTSFCPLLNNQFKLNYMQDPMLPNGTMDMTRYRLNASNP